MTKPNTAPSAEQTLFLSEIIGRKIIWNGKKIGKLGDLVIRETLPVPEVTHIIVTRSFGYKSLLVPWTEADMSEREVKVGIPSLESREKDHFEGLILLRDYILDKKVLDMEDREVEVVYDIRLVLRKNQLFVISVDCSRYSFLRRIGLKRLASFIQGLAAWLTDESIPWKYMQPLPENLSSFHGAVKLTVLKEKLSDLHPVDLADILEEMDHDGRMAVFNELDTEKASDTLEEIEPRVQRALLSSIKIERAAELIDQMTPAQAADVLAILPAADADELLALIEKEKARKIEFIIDEHDKSVTHIASPHYIAFPPQTKAGRIVEDFAAVAKDKAVTMYVYVIDVDGRIVGVADINEVIQADREAPLSEIMTEQVISLKPEDSLIEAAEMFARYGFRAIPVVDDDDMLQGVIPYRDVMNLKHSFL